MTSRREFLQSTGAVLGTTWLATRWSEVLATGTAAGRARDDAKPFVALAAADAADLAAIAERIIPSGETPGAREAGVIWFMDQALSGFMSAALGLVTSGLADLNRRVLAEGLETRFVGLDAQAQDRLLTAIEAEPFFEAVHFMTLAGLFAMPAHGGNRDHVGWKLIGFEHAHGWQPPFGYYDGRADKDNGEST